MYKVCYHYLHTLQRLIAKFCEKEYEKLDRLLELREKYEDAVSSAEAKANEGTFAWP